MIPSAESIHFYISALFILVLICVANTFVILEFRLTLIQI